MGMRVLVDGYLRGRLTFHMVRPSAIFAKGWKRRAKAAKVMASGLTDFS